MSGSKNTDQNYGVHSVLNWGRWRHSVVVFDTPEEAQEWLHEPHACDTDFGETRIERELMSKADAVQLAGRYAVNKAVNYKEVVAYWDRMNGKSEHSQEAKRSKRQTTHRSAPER